MKKVISRLGSHNIEGKLYPNLPSICKDYNISLNAIYKRWSRGKRDDDLVPLKKRKAYLPPIIKPKYKLIINGLGYKSYAEACRKLNVEFITFRKRKEKGFSVRQSLGLDPMPDGRNKPNKKKGKRTYKKIELVINGKKYKSYKYLYL